MSYTQTPYSWGSPPEAVPFSSRDLSPWYSCLTETSVLQIHVAWACKERGPLNKVVSLLPAEQGSDPCSFSGSWDSCYWEKVLPCSLGSGWSPSFQPRFLLYPHNDWQNLQVARGCSLLHHHSRILSQGVYLYLGLKVWSPSSPDLR